MAGDENGRNRATMTLPEYEAWLHSMVTGSIHGIWRIAGDFTEREPSKYPLLDDSIMFEVAILLAATIIEGNSQYRDAAAFGEGAEMVRDMFLERLRDVRRLQGARRDDDHDAYRQATGEMPVPHAAH